MITHRHNSGGIVGGTILISVGLLFLLAQFLHVEVWGLLWPLFIVVVGAVFFVGMLAGGKSAASLAIPGSIIGTVGLMLLAQNLTGYWSSWSYAWTIILMAVGVGLYIAGLWGDSARQRRAGLRVMEIGFGLFVFFGAFFELVLGGFDGSPLRQAFFPVLLILAGLYLLVRRSGLWPGWLSTPEPPAASSPEPPAGTPGAQS